MIRTIYLKLVLSFIAAVIGGLAASFFVTTALYKDRIAASVQQGISANGNVMSSVLNRLSPEEREAFIGDIARTQHFTIWMFDGQGRLIARYGQDSGEEAVALELAEKAGGKTQFRSRGFLPNVRNIYFGVPLQTGEQAVYLVFHPDYAHEVTNFDEMMRTLLLIALGFGSLLIILVARYLVKPIRELTTATKRIARGEYDIRLETRRKDELGVLSASFQSMAGELKQLEEMRQEFVSNVSHEIQSPLASIAGFVSILRSDTLGEKERQRYLGIIEGESRRLSRLSENLLRLASLDSQRHPFQPAAFRLDRQLGRSAVALEPLLTAGRLDLVTELPRVTYVGDEELLSQVWQNLLHNSIKFTPPGGEIAILLELRVKDVVVTIRDTGIGIAEEDRRRMFERFFKADKSHRRGPESDDGGRGDDGSGGVVSSDGSSEGIIASGSGLGLAIVKRIVDLHDGEVRVESEPGRGTSVIVTLPSRSMSAGGGSGQAFGSGEA
ncbi:sensor histidine kinase [Paenibacillus chartarius]|uniref:Heme sensor protein HssS n=1 Tax=Paenibacillus chartarius TaxID=747481 RepID=A0ABV6DR56_9BACL